MVLTLGLPCLLIYLSLGYAWRVFAFVFLLLFYFFPSPPIRSGEVFSSVIFFLSFSSFVCVFGCSDGIEREACVCDHGYERSDLCAEIIIIIIIILIAQRWTLVVVKMVCTQKSVRNRNCLKMRDMYLFPFSFCQTGSAETHTKPCKTSPQGTSIKRPAIYWDHAVSWGGGIWVSVSDIGRVGKK